MAEPDQFALHAPSSHAGFSAAMRMTSFLTAAAVGGRPDRRRAAESHFRGTSRRCQTTMVAGVTGKIPAQRQRGTSRERAASHIRSTDL